MAGDQDTVSWKTMKHAGPGQPDVAVNATSESAINETTTSQKTKLRMRFRASSLAGALDAMRAYFAGCSYSSFTSTAASSTK